MTALKKIIRQIKNNLNYVMAADYHYFQSEIDAIARSYTEDKDLFYRKLSSLQKKIRISGARLNSRAACVPALQYPADLPICAGKDKIISAIVNNQTVIITGETGSGKTTQIPKMCLDAGRGIRGIIGHTQPRRIAATSIARRIAEELGEFCGQSVAYKIRFEEQTSAEPLIKVITDGILLSEIQNDPLLLAYDTIIVDEAHERSLNIDFILGFLRTLLIRRKDLKLIITSATMDTARFVHAFEAAPVIEVSGRMYPVEVRYQPLDPVKEEKGEITYIDEAIACVEKLQKERCSGDILIFMPTEQDIRETCSRLNKQCSGVILPLYSRLTANQQRAVFDTFSQQKIIVATNIAETSLTIPGIKYVIDTGLARMLKYNPRLQTTGLPVAPISQSSAVQRKGRCGRLQNGVCIRLYSSQNFAERPQHTPPEIMRSNLAGVILRMLSLNLGPISDFPFIDRPHSKSIRDGLEILRDLGAIEVNTNKEESESYVLTPIGREMSRFPLDPRISRILIAAEKEECINEVAIIAAALSIVDPRERPYEKSEQASKAHARFQHVESDFLTYLNIWNHYSETLEKIKTQNKLRKFCLEHFLSYRRMIEWRDIYAQILDIISEKKSLRSGRHTKVEIDQKLADKVHRCLLTGYLTHIARKKEKNFFTAAKSREVMIYPGSGLFNRAGNWIVAAEISQTSRLFARNIANIKSEWLEEICRNHCRYSYSAPRWEKNRGQVVANEKVTLFGLTIVETRTVSFDRINPEEAWKIFIREALVPGEVGRRIPFLEHNLSFRNQIISMEEKLRKRGIAADEETIALLYEQKLPVLSDIRSLLKLIKERGKDDFLRFREDELILSRPDKNEIGKYPDQIPIGDAAFPCTYRFAPGQTDDGVTVKIPLGMIAQTSKENAERFLPNLQKEKIIALLKLLPKSLRNRLPAPSSVADLFLKQINQSNLPLIKALSRFLLDEFYVTIPPESWNTQKLPPHLNILFSVIDENGAEIKSSRDLTAMQDQLAGAANVQALDKIRDQWEKNDIASWNFGTLPEKIPLHNRYGLSGYAYPALQVCGNSINIRLFSDQIQSEASHVQGIAAMYSIYFKEKIKQLKKSLALSAGQKAQAAELGSSKTLEQSIMNRIVKDLFYLPIRSGEDFLKHAEEVNMKILPHGRFVMDAIEPVLKAFVEAHNLLQKLTFKNYGNHPVQSFLEKTRADLVRLIPPNFPEIYSFERMKELPRYLKTIEMRAERGCLNPASALIKVKEIEFFDKFRQEFQQNIVFDSSDDKRKRINDFFWMIEEYKVSLFAQELKTPYPVSPKKLMQAIKAIEEII